MRQINNDTDKCVESFLDLEEKYIQNNLLNLNKNKNEEITPIFKD